MAKNIDDFEVPEGFSLINDASFIARIGKCETCKIQAENKALKKRAEAAEEDWQLAEAEKKRLKKAQKRKTCMCMDCGKVIKVTEQTKHLKECPHSKP